ncbi:endonuclease/exonuclease/phosphatase family protein [Neorhizobium galegae]|uniref:endonuclease/exonuclease/phosphatase family protein n=1 Tax=Neorhizobium galegae TaxID=399 RepID=UPI000621621D|nr:endonuclease/exonuclease/phosphatase family protein [Neorhizobium galegae]CDZ27252.1 Metal-dependent hydrolase [Neorhizobium galegae bv. officinalis]KAA9385093.1 endonuclease/exonuclease/phosphatase family protein [Neorhizobium galegae]KAB1110568.1 endonuclease/exonuclease/phosphatase family protein [Neorhizobium galegae]MCM2497831.1 endonuclease/exonuclease/phosphatase family protein [Neorhizobium galegae]MCQ1768940.1 endonuclease/exonuclease/phosphatase family protein [Neorhizobium galega
MREKRPNLPKSILASIRARRNRGAGTHEGLERGHGMLIASYNVHKCVGIDGRFDPARTSHVIREIGADVIALQEADSRFGERRGLLDLAWMERETGLFPVPVSGVAKAHGWHGNVILFREGLVRDVHQVKLPGLEPRGALITELELKDGSAFRIIAAHLGLLNRSRQQQARMILDILRSRDEQPTVLMGDLNEWRLGDRSSLNTLATVFGLPAAVPSFPSRLPVLALDRIMANQPGLIDAVETHDSPLARLASDHLPIKAVVKLGSAPLSQEAEAG